MAKTKAQKKLARRKQFEKSRNLESNRAKAKFRLDVYFPISGWRTMAGFKDRKQVDAYVEQQEGIRDRNESDILEGKIIDLATGKTVAVISPYDKDPVPEGIESVKNIEPKGSIAGKAKKVDD